MESIAPIAIMFGSKNEDFITFLPSLIYGVSHFY